MYLTKAYLEKAYGATQVAALCATDDEIDTTIELAESEVESALEMGGYSNAVPASVYAAIGDVPKIVKLAAYGAWLELAHLRNGIQLPNEAQAYVRKIEDIRSGKLELPGLSKDTERAVGGIAVTESSTSIEVSDGSRPQIFSRSGMDGY